MASIEFVDLSTGVALFTDSENFLTDLRSDTQIKGGFPTSIFYSLPIILQEDTPYIRPATVPIVPITLAA